MTKKLLMGNEAMAHAALEAGVRVVAGYPGTPSSEIVETVAKLHAAGNAHGVHVEWSTNEKVALELLFGASLAGARGLFTCKQMGLNVASDALLSLNYVSVRGGLVLVVADDPGPISSQTEQDTRRFAAFAKVPVLDPSSPEQAYEMVKAAFELSERFHTPVIVRPTTRIDHASAFFDVEDETFANPVPEQGFERDPSKWIIFPRRSYRAHGEINERLVGLANAFSSETPYSDFNEVRSVPADKPEQASFGIMAGGISAAYALEAMRVVEQRAAQAGIEVPAYRFMQVGTAYPFPVDAVSQFVKGLSDVLVLEELDYVLEDELAKYVGRVHVPLTVHGKLTGEARDRGENDVDDVASSIERFLGLSGRLRLYRREQVETATQAPIAYEEADNLPVRPPVLCPGCPHRGSFYAVKQALRGTAAVLCGDIGCYTLGNAQPLDAIDTCLCMGAGVTMAQGLAAVDPGKKAIAFIGDSTFFASGMTGLANAAYNGHDITVMVLDNATTAMTGSQPHPGTGHTLMGGHNKPLSIEEVLLSCGFAHVYHANPLDKEGSIVAAETAIAYEGPSAVIFESPCIQLIKPDEPVSIDPDTCTGCKKCITEIGCPGIGFDPLRKGPRSGSRGQAFIDTTLCNGCDLCVQVCPFKAIGFPLPDGEFLDLDEDEVFEIAEPAANGLAFASSDLAGQELELEEAAPAHDEGMAPGKATSFGDGVALGETADLSGLDEAVGVYDLDDGEDWLVLPEQGEEAFSAEGASDGSDDATVALSPIEPRMNDDVTVALDPAELGIVDDPELPKTDELAALEADEPKADEAGVDEMGAGEVEPEADGAEADLLEASQPEPEQPESDEPEFDQAESDQAEPDQPEAGEPEQDASEQPEPDQLELEGASQDEQEPGEPEPVDESALTRILFIETDIEDLAPEQGGQDD
ncbi:MAG: 4Fe-4S binding protein [Eggerthellaceae bacterium]|nr:4Fe-4S binding protein [Eggerthellaceae bacterium]